VAANPFVFYAELGLGAVVTGNPNGWSWTDVTSYVGGDAITITRGRGDRFSDAAADRCTLTFLNSGGRFVPRNPLSPYYGQLRPGTPLRILIRPDVNSASDAFNRTAASTWASADAGGPWTIVGTASDYSVSPTNGGRHTNTAITSHFSTLAFSLIRVDIKVRIRVNALSTGTGGQQAGVTYRYVDSANQRRCELVFAVGGAMTLRLVARTAGTDLTTDSTSVSLTHSTSTWYWLRLQTGYTSARAKVWADGTTEPASWNLIGSALSPVAGAVGVFTRRETGNTNTAPTTDFDDFSMVDGPRIQFTGFVDEWPVTWGDHALTQSYVPISASGQLRRLERAQPLKSATYREATALTSVVGYWPMEDGSKAQFLASAIQGGPPGGFSGMALASDSAVDGSDPLPVFSTATSRIWFPVPTYTSSGAWTVAWVMKIPASSISGAAQVMSWITPGSTIGRWQVTLAPGTPDVIRIDAYTPAGVPTSGGTVNFVDATSGAELSDGRQLYFVVSGTQNGGNVDTSLYAYYAADADGTVSSVVRSDSFAGTTGRVGYAYHDAVTGFAGAGHTIGHVLLGNTNATNVSAETAVAGGAGDTTSARFTALLATQGITAIVGDLVRGQTSTTQQMGPQRTGDIMSQLREVEDTEEGLLHDGKQGFVEMLPRVFRYNRPVDLAVDVNAGDVGWPFAPTDDDYLLRNTVTVTNAGGSPAVASDPTSIAYEGVRPDSSSVNVYRGIDLQQHANWRLAMGTTGTGLRYPQIELNMTARSLALAMAWLDTDIGSRITVAHVPHNELPPEDLDLLVEGYEETISSTEWTVRLNCSPGSQWLTAVLDASTPRLDCGASTTSGTLTTSATSVPLTIADTCTWVHTSGDYPIYIGGEEMTVTAVSAPAGSGSSWTQTLTVTRSTNGISKTHAAGEAVHVAVPIILAL
jgi:hypothetical protein